MSTTIIIGSIIGALIGAIIGTVIFKRQYRNETIEDRRREFPGEVKDIILSYIFNNLIRKDSKLVLATLHSTEKILDYLGLEDVGDLENEEILKIVRSVQPPMYVLRALEANFNLIEKVKEKGKERNVLVDSVFEKVFPKLNFELWDNMDYRKKRILINEILEGMENRGELKTINKNDQEN